MRGVAVAGALTLAFAPRNAHAEPVYALFLADELEVQGPDSEVPIAWDTLAWIGGNQNRVWLKTEGDLDLASASGEVEAQLLYSRLIAPFWELQVGARADYLTNGVDRGFLVLGLEGLAPYWFEIEPAIFISHRGELSARLVASHDVFITQRLIAQPSIEANLNLQAVPDAFEGAGPTDLIIGARVRYEARREFAPYLGFEYEQLLLDTATMAVDAGSTSRTIRGVAGLRLWY